jgi:hypothetical protein
MKYRHDTECERYRDLPINDVNQCSYCLIAIGARSEGWAGAREQIEEAAKRLPLTDEQRETVATVLQLAKISTPRNFFFPKVRARKEST